MCVAAAQDMQNLIAENARLVSELNAFRAQLGNVGMPPLELSPITKPMTQLMNVKNEVSGEFPAGFGDNWAYTNRETPRTGSDSSVDDEEARRSLDGSIVAPARLFHAPLSVQEELPMPYIDFSDPTPGFTLQGPSPLDFMSFSDNQAESFDNFFPQQSAPLSSISLDSYRPPDMLGHIENFVYS